jgi:hypothetical protein
MKLFSIMVFLSFMNLPVAFCPNIKTFYIPTDSPIISKPIYTASYEPLIKAIFRYETHNNVLAYNSVEEAYGGLQIRPCRLKHYNDLTGSNYTLQDMYDFNKAKEVFLYFATHDRKGRPVKGKSYEQVAKNWNGSGPMTIKYWEAIQPLIQI